MRNDSMLDLADCTEFRQALRAATPRSLHVTLILSVLLLAAAVSWMSLTRARLVVRASGRVRPVSESGVLVDEFSHDVSSEEHGDVERLLRSATLPRGGSDAVAAGEGKGGNR